MPFCGKDEISAVNEKSFATLKGQSAAPPSHASFGRNYAG